MLFNSEVFIFAFLPLVLLGFFTLGVYNLNRLATAWLVFVSVIFYAWFRVDYLVLLSILIVINYILGMRLSRRYRMSKKSPFLLTLGILVNLGVLFYYKYSNFILSNTNHVFGTNYILHDIIMPVGISFFIFQKIGYLVDAYRGEAKEYNFLDFCLFVMYFPQLIAGPIVHHKEIIPQFRQASIFKLNFSDMSGGLILFMLGLLKKSLIADKLLVWVEPAFSAVQQGWKLSFLEAWGGALGFAFQIYFDFSAYTDMALGLALMIGIRLPLNFNSPYKAKNIIDFWRRWHMTLSRFLRDYVYISLGGNRHGSLRRYGNLLLTMLVGGLWHGAAWTFIAWGALHGFYLIVNHIWQFLKIKFDWDLKGLIYSVACQATTFTAVVVAWLFFRAQTFDGAMIMLRGIIGLNGFALPEKYESKLGVLGATLKSIGVHFSNPKVAYCPGIEQLLFLLGLLLIVWVLPNSQQFCAQYKPALGTMEAIKLNRWFHCIFGFQFQSNGTLTVVASPILGVTLALTLLGLILWQVFNKTALQSFIYFQF